MIDCAVVGASGYTGAELTAILARHPEARIRSVHAAESAGKRWEQLYPGRAHLFQGEILPFEPEALAGIDVVFLAQPHGVSARSAAALDGKVGKVIDLSGDLRLESAAEYRQWYGQEHPAPGLLGKAVYGLPELFRDKLKGARLIACAGCYATVSQLAAYPALKLDEGSPHDVVISAMSGTTGAGRKADLELSFSEVGDNLRAYRIGRHQHAPEIAQGLRRATGQDLRVTFVPHLVPLRRGILATVVLGNWSGATQAELVAAYREAYARCPFVRVVDPAERLPQVGDVAGTNFCDLAPVIDPAAGTIVVVGVIDNLVKGAAGQAVQVMNLACGLDETAGLLWPRSRAAEAGGL